MMHAGASASVETIRFLLALLGLFENLASKLICSAGHVVTFSCLLRK